LLNQFNYFKPQSEIELIEQLSSSCQEAKILAGGTDLLIYMKQGLVDPRALIDIKGVSDYSKISTEIDGSVTIVASVTCNELIDNDCIRNHFPILVEAAKTLGSYQLRNRATVVGNICNASPAADMAGPFLVLGATIIVGNISGGREMPIKDFFISVKKTALKPGEFVKAIKVPSYFRNANSGYLKASRIKGHDLGICNVAMCRVNGTLKVAIGSCAIKPVLLPDFDSTRATTDLVVGDAIKSINPINDIRGSKEYRQHMVKVFIKRLLEKGNSH
jgi:CO/xanthine dehydrogenase FAD-binding subunit